MELENFIENVKQKSEDMGFCFDSQPRKVKNAVWRKNIHPEKEEDFRKGAYFGLVNANEEPIGAYSDFSLVIFPNAECTHFVIALGVGSLGFNKDYSVATLPWLRRLFSRLRDGKYAGKQFFKVDFSDIETSSAVTNHLDGVDDLREVIGKYQTVLPACQIVEIQNGEEEEALEIVWQWLATYATFRKVGNNKKQRDEINKYLPAIKDLDDYTETAIYHQLLNERFIVLQGAPGTGKTWTANKIGELHFSGETGKTYFEQFHAETTYSDFVYGIKPKTTGDNLSYEEHYGILWDAIEYAHESGKATLLIIDEINRANLSNVLGPIFYLFEKNAGHRQNVIKIGNKKITKLPENLYVIATMNTADRSLAVVDFALRRRFSWITLRPHVIEAQSDNLFLTDEFNRFSEIFSRYASSEELNLQPGQSYFVAKSEDAWRQRLRYELVPLMKEYFDEGYLKNAVSEFSDYVYDKLGIDLYE
jgi:hypothetical protein